MRRYIFFVLLLAIISSVFISCAERISNFPSDSNDETESRLIEAEETISDFFDLYARGKYTSMQSLTTGELKENDYSLGVFGMKTATVIKCELNEDLMSEITDDNILIFHCTFEMTPAEDSSIGTTSGITGLYIDVTMVDGVWKISNVHTGK